jgi:hypothetical protein
VTVRWKDFAGVTTYAGTVPELAAIALEYADGQRDRRLTADQRARFEAAAAALNAGIVAEADGVQFWPDRADGTPFEGNRDYRPDPDPAWAAETRRRAHADARR